MNDGYQSILDAGAAVLIAISNDTVWGIANNLQGLSLSYIVLSDSNDEAINAYNVFEQPNMRWANPTAFIVDADGVIQWKDSGSRYGHRTTSTQIIDALNGL